MAVFGDPICLTFPANMRRCHDPLITRLGGCQGLVAKNLAARKNLAANECP
jgi:hypothetical protein